MITLLDVVERALTGRPCYEREYNNVFSSKLKEVIKEYGIKYDPNTPIPSDNTLADDVFQAALDFYLDVGTYCLDTGRIIKFNESEIKDALKTSPSQLLFGEGMDAKIMVPRTPESKISPWCFLGAGGAPVSSEEVFLKLVEGYASIDLANSITTPALTSVRGMRIRPGSPLEILGTIRTIVLAREALRRAGRPGLPIMNALATATAAVSLNTALHPNYGLRKTDGYLIAITAELKTSFDLLNKVCALQSLGYGGICSEYGPVYGGYCGGPEGTAIAAVAGHFMGVLVYRAGWHLIFPIHINYGCNSTPELLWVTSVYAQAISRNTHLLSLHLNYTAAGPCTEMCLYEIAAQRLAAIPSGASGIESLGAAKATHEDYTTPMEPRFAAEVAHAIVGMKRSDANEIVKKLLPKYTNKIANPPLGFKYQECYDTSTGKPSQRCLEIYSKVKKELEDLGLEFKL
jgi:methylamine--corrinoid protein Co-methyltransferase